MSYLKFVKDLFLEEQELNRMQRFLTEDGLKLDFKNNAERLGIVYNEKYDPNFTFFKPEVTNVTDTFKINAGYAYNIDGTVLKSLGITIILPQKDKYYWLKIRHKYSSTEIGTISIGGTNGGLMTGIGTKFTEVLRGQPNFPAKIKFTNSVNYALEYELNEVVDDVTAYVQGSFPTFEQNLNYEVVGTFTPKVTPADADKFPFQYDDFDYELVSELTNNTQPDLIADTEFFVCRVISSSANGVQVEDKRRNFIYRTRAERLYDDLPVITNPLIAIESIGKKVIRNKIFYIVKIGIGFVITGETRNNNLNKVIINNGFGGSYKSTSAFTTGNFDEWRYYYANGEYSRIISSTKVAGNTIELIVDSLNQNVVGAMVCPPVEEVEFKLKFYNEDDTTTYKNRLEKFYSFTPEINVLIAEDELSDGVGDVGITTRVKTVFKLSSEYNLNISTYTVDTVGDVTSNVIKLTAASGGGSTQTAWRGIDAYCELDSITPDIYYKVDTRNHANTTDWFPNSTNPVNSNVRDTYDLYVKFYSDSGLTTPYTFTKNGMNIVILMDSSITANNYDSGGSLTSTNSYTTESIILYNVNVVAANEVFLGNINTTVTQRTHPTLSPSVFRVDQIEIDLPAVFPDTKIFVGRTTKKGFTNLEQYFVATTLPTGVTKPNAISDVDYIAPAIDASSCPFIIPHFNLQYGYSLNIHQVTLTAGSGARNGLPVSNTQSGGYLYVIKQFNQDEDVSIQVNAQTIASNNLSGLVFVRVTWRATGATSDTVSQFQIPSNSLTSLPITFRNISIVNISNF